MRSRSAILLVAFCISMPSTAADKQQLAAKLFDAVVMPQAEPVVDRMLMAFVREKRPPEAVVQIYRESILEVFHHPDYRRAYVTAYTQLFSEQELLGLVELGTSPSFLAYAREAGNVTSLTYPTFMQLNSVMKQKIEGRLTERGLAAWK